MKICEGKISPEEIRDNKLTKILETAVNSVRFTLIELINEGAAAKILYGVVTSISSLENALRSVEDDDEFTDSDDEDDEDGEFYEGEGRN